VSGGSAAGVERDGRGRRVSERDRFGAAVATLTWASDGRLERAAVRLPDGGWVRIEPRAADDARWGASDRLCLGDATLSHFSALDWAAVDTIPVLVEPARLPPGAGTAVLNLVAALAADQRRPPLAYRGPYPTEQLFLALLESFRWCAGPPATDDPLRAFMAGGLTWAPAPHTRVFAPPGVYVQSRARIEKVVWRRRVYYRRDWQGVERRATHRVRDVDGRVVCSLWALDTPLEDHLVLAADASVVDMHEPPDEAAPARPAADAVRAGLVALVVATSAPPLAAAIREVGTAVPFEWAPLAGDLARLDDRRARLSVRLLRTVAARSAAAPSRAERVRLGFAALTELAHALGDELRRRAQAHLAAAPLGVQAAALRGRTAVGAAAAAAEVGSAVEALLDEAAQLLA
jgi:hypothetical protein